jgi:small subunit ribosomal protein S28e
MPGEQAKEEVRILDGYAAEVVEVIKGHTGLYGEIKQVMCKILEGRDRGRVIRRNVAGRIKKGDILRLPDTNREARPIVAR